jgi:integrase
VQRTLFFGKEKRMAARKDGKGRALRKGEHYRKSDGRYSYGYTDMFGKRKFIYSNNLSKLREREEQLIRDQMDGLDVYVAGSVNINYVFDRYLSTKSELRSTTKSNYIYTWDHFIRDGFGKKKIGDVKYSDVLYFYNYLITEKGLQITSVENINTVLHPTFQLAVRDDIIRKNPVDGAYAEIKKRYGGSRKLRHALTVEQQREFMRYVADNPVFYTWYPFFTVLLGTGCRIGEIIGLRWDDVNMEERLIDINHSLTYYPRREETYVCEFRVSLPKTEAGKRVIPMMEQVYQVLKEEYERQQEEGFCDKVIDGMTNFIFTNRFGGPHNPAAVNRAIKRIVDAHNAEEEVAAKKQKRKPIMIPRFSCHIFRHTFASRICENETNIKVIQQIMGHADVSTTMNIYAEVNTETTRESLENLSKNLDVF